MLVEVFIGITTFLLVISVRFYYHKFKISYWTRLGVPQDDPTFPLGTCGQVTLGWKGYEEVLGEQYLKFKGSKYVGNYSFSTPFLVIRDPELAKKIVKDKQHFGRDESASKQLVKIPNISKGCQALAGALSRDHRELKGLKGILQVHVDKLLRVLEYSNEPVDISVLARRLCHGAIVSSAVGADADIGKEDEEISVKTASAIRETVKRVLKERSTNSEAKKRLDLLDLMLDYLPIEDDLEDTMIAGSTAAVMFGRDSSSKVIAKCISSIAKNSKVQKKLQDEIDEAYEMFCGYGTDLGTLLELPYLDTVIKETLRLYPQHPYMTRVCSKEFEIPDSDPGFSLQPGQRVLIPVSAIQSDPAHYKKPDRFDPDGHFIAKKKGTKKDFTISPSNDWSLCPENWIKAIRRREENTQL